MTENKAHTDAKSYGGAMAYGNATNCTFKGNTAFDDEDDDCYAGAMYKGNAYDCTFIENRAHTDGGAVYNTNAYNCTFIKNKANVKGGAMYKGYAFNCTFKDNIVEGHDYDSEAMYEGSACLCTFNGDSTYDTKIIHTTINVLNYTSTYKSGEKLIFNLTAKDKVLDGFNITIEIYKDGSLVKTVDALSGEGWIVDLEPGEYTTVLSILDHPDEKSANATITVRSTFTDLNTTINGNTNSTIYLTNNDYYKYDNTSDEKLTNGITINRDLIIYGNGATINGDKMARIFNVINNHNVNFYNITFINGKADNGGNFHKW